jgi:hypothetical protein
MPGFLL